MTQHQGRNWTLHEGDCIPFMMGLKLDTIDFSIFSPPFMSLYTYTATEADIGNSKDSATFFKHFQFVINELLKMTKPGRLTAVHVSQIPAMLERDGWIGLKDFRGDTISHFVDAGWIYHGDITIDKNPQVQAIRTHAKGLLFAQVKRDGSWLRPGLADYLLIFRKPGDNQTPIKPDISNDEWIQWAHPVWYGIRETHTLNTREAKAHDEERHICPLQLDLIERAIRLWSNPGELVFSPFTGIGSEGYVALKWGRRFLGAELKDSYCNVAVKNLKSVDNSSQPLLALIDNT